MIMASPYSINYQSDNSMLFDGVDEYVLIGDISAYEIDTFSVSAWVKRSSTAGNHCIFSNQYSASGGNVSGWFVKFKSDDTVLYNQKYGANLTETVATAATFTSTANWYHVVLTKSGTTLKIYVDDNLELNTTLTASSIDYATGITKSSAIGVIRPTTGTPQEFFHGYIDDVKFFNVELTAAQVTSEYNSGCPNYMGNHPNALGYWEMGDTGDITSINDMINNNNGTPTNMESGDINTTVPC